MVTRAKPPPARAYVLRCKDIETLSRLLADRVGHLAITATTIDGGEQEFHSGADACAIENPWPQRVICLRFSARSEDCHERAAVRFGDDRECPILVEVEGSSQVVEDLRKDLASFVRGVSRRYGRLARSDFLVTGFLSCILSVLASRVLLALWIWDTKTEPPGGERPYHEVLAVAILFAIIAIGATLNLFREPLFPAGVIAIGKARKPQRKRARYRRILLGLFITLPVFLIAVLLWA